MSPFSRNEVVSSEFISETLKVGRITNRLLRSGRYWLKSKEVLSTLNDMIWWLVHTGDFGYRFRTWVGYPLNLLRCLKVTPNKLIFSRREETITAEGEWIIQRQNFTKSISSISSSGQKDTVNLLFVPEISANTKNDNQYLRWCEVFSRCN